MRTLSRNRSALGVGSSGYTQQPPKAAPNSRHGAKRTRAEFDHVRHSPKPNSASSDDSLGKSSCRHLLMPHVHCVPSNALKPPSYRSPKVSVRMNESCHRFPHTQTKSEKPSILKASVQQKLSWINVCPSLPH